jgi:hypothetical protein
MKSIEQTIQDVSVALSKKLSPKVLHWALVADGWEVERAAKIIRWAKMSAEKVNA